MSLSFLIYFLLLFLLITGQGKSVQIVLLFIFAAQKAIVDAKSEE